MSKNELLKRTKELRERVIEVKKCYERGELSEEDANRMLEELDITSQKIQDETHKVLDKIALCDWCGKNGSLTYITIDLDEADPENPEEKLHVAVCSAECAAVFVKNRRVISFMKGSRKQRIKRLKEMLA